jgi:hypothetical protein
MDDNRPEETPPSTLATRSGSGTDVSALVVELGELARHAPDRLTERIRALSIREQAELALRLPAEERLSLMLHAPRPMRLVRSLPDAELYLTVRELGPADALPLIALASADQLTHVLDLESWRQDRFDAKRAGAWVALLLEAGEPTIRRFLRSADDEMLALLFHSWARVSSIDFEADGAVELHGVRHSESGDELGLISPDGAFRFSPVIPEHAPAIRLVAQILYRDQPARYQEVLWAGATDMAAELEEATLHWRQSRLEEHGFPPWEEALSVYAAPSGARVHPRPAPSGDVDGLPTSLHPLRVLSPADRLLGGLERLPVARRDDALHELISVANRLLVADSADSGDPEAHRDTLRTAAGYIDIALEVRQAEDPSRVSTLLCDIPLVELFREGYAAAARLQHAARQLVETGWVQAHPRSLELLDSPLRERIEWLISRRPHYLEILEDGRAAARPFRRLREIDETARALELTRLIGTLMVERLGLEIACALQGTEDEVHPPLFSTYFLTLLAWHSSRGETRGDPLPADATADFLRNVASRRTAGPDAPLNALDRLIEAIALSFGLSASETALLRSFGRAALERLSAECSRLDPGLPVDSRHVSCLLLE